MKSARKKAVDHADKWFSLYIRELTQQEVGHCVFCSKPVEHCFHFFSRVAYATRWTELNAVGSCSGCNMRMEFAPYQFYKWFEEQYGRAALDTLDRQWHTIVKLSTAEIREIGDKFKQKYEELKGNTK